MDGILHDKLVANNKFVDNVKVFLDGVNGHSVIVNNNSILVVPSGEDREFKAYLAGFAGVKMVPADLDERCLFANGYGQRHGRHGRAPHSKGKFLQVMEGFFPTATMKVAS